MATSEKLNDLLSSLTLNQEKIALKLLSYIDSDQFSKARLQELIREDIRELIIEVNQNATK